MIGAAGNPTTSTATPDWSKILSDPTFHFATNGTSLVSVAANNTGPTKGGFGYNGAITFPLAGSTAGATIQAFAVAWQSQYANPWIAAANGSNLGWSSVISYATAPDSGSSALSFAAQGMPGFGVSPVPEPATFALAGLGAAAMLIFRRRK